MSEFPLRAKAVGEDVEVVGVDIDEEGESLVAKCRRKEKTYSVLLTEIDFPKRFPGRDWIAAYFQYQGMEL